MQGSTRTTLNSQSNHNFIGSNQTAIRASSAWSRIYHLRYAELLCSLQATSLSTMDDIAEATIAGMTPEVITQAANLAAGEFHATLEPTYWQTSTHEQRLRDYAAIERVHRCDDQLFTRVMNLLSNADHGHIASLINALNVYSDRRDASKQNLETIASLLKGPSTIQKATQANSYKPRKVDLYEGIDKDKRSFASFSREMTQYFISSGQPDSRHGSILLDTLSPQIRADLVDAEFVWRQNNSAFPDLLTQGPPIKDVWTWIISSEGKDNIIQAAFKKQETSDQVHNSLSAFTTSSKIFKETVADLKSLPTAMVGDYSIAPAVLKMNYWGKLHSSLKAALSNIRVSPSFGDASPVESFMENVRQQAKAYYSAFPNGRAPEPFQGPKRNGDQASNLSGIKPAKFKNRQVPKSRSFLPSFKQTTYRSNGNGNQGHYRQNGNGNESQNRQNQRNNQSQSQRQNDRPQQWQNKFQNNQKPNQHAVNKPDQQATVRRLQNGPQRHVTWKRQRDNSADEKRPPKRPFKKTKGQGKNG